MENGRAPRGNATKTANLSRDFADRTPVERTELAFKIDRRTPRSRQKSLGRAGPLCGSRSINPLTTRANRFCRAGNSARASIENLNAPGGNLGNGAMGNRATGGVSKATTISVCRGKIKTDLGMGKKWKNKILFVRSRRRRLLF